MSIESYKAEYQASIKAHRIVKDLIKTRMPQGQTLDQVQPGPKNGNASAVDPTMPLKMFGIAQGLPWMKRAVGPMKIQRALLDSIS